MEIGDRIRKLRIAKDMTLEELASKVGLQKAAIYKYESGKVVNLKQSTISALATALDTTPAYLMGYEDNKEQNHDNIVQFPAVSQRVQELSKIDDCLNKTGHTQFVKYGEFLIGQDEYKVTDADYEPIVEYIRDYDVPSAAGYASPIEGEDFHQVPRDNLTPPHADFSIHVQGDSMMPYINDGQRVFVQRGVDLQEWDVGVFYFEGSVYIKQYCPSYDGSVYLMSANPEREDANVYISKDSASLLMCFGKVILGHKLPIPDYAKKGPDRRQ